MFGENGEDVYFTAILTGVPESKEAYERTIVSRSYSKRNGKYYYSEIREISVLGVAKRLRDNGYPGLAGKDLDVVKNVLTVCGESTEA